MRRDALFNPFVLLIALACLLVAGMASNWRLPQWGSPKSCALSSDLVNDAGAPVYPRGAGKVIDDHVAIEDGSDSILPYTTFRFNEASMPRPAVFMILADGDSLLLLSSDGIVKFSPNTGRWLMYGVEGSLPAGRVWYMAQDERDCLLIHFQDDSGSGATGQYWVAEDGYIPTKLRAEHIAPGGWIGPHNSSVKGHVGLFDTRLKLGGDIWVAIRGQYDENTREYANGGVYRLDATSLKGDFFNEENGLSSAAAYSLAVDHDGGLWVSHGDTDKGLSMLPSTGNHFVPVSKSANDVAIGGDILAAIGRFLLVGRTDGLVIYDPQSRLALAMNEDSGLPGYDVTNILVVDDVAWIGAVSYRRDGYRKAGLMRIALDDIEGYFTDAVQNSASLEK